MEPTPASEYLPGLDARLIVTDMDGTLLDGDANVPERLWPLLRIMRERGAIFAPASGRQYHTLAAIFSPEISGMPIIAENGSYVVRDGAEISSLPLDREFVTMAVERLRELVSRGRNLGIVLAGKRAAYVERSDPEFMEQVETYYHSNEILEDQLDTDDDIIKIAIYDFDDAETGTYPHIADMGETHAVVVSGEHWIDIMDTRVNKGSAVKALQQELGITPAQTVAFGDYLNDLEMLEASGASFATANAHPDVIAAARWVAPANTEEGVIDVLENIFVARPH